MALGVSLQGCQVEEKSPFLSNVHTIIRDFINENYYYDTFIISAFLSKQAHEEDTIIRLGTIPISKVDTFFHYGDYKIGVEAIDVDPSFLLRTDYLFIECKESAPIADCGLYLINDAFRTYKYNHYDDSYSLINQNQSRYKQYAKLIVEWRLFLRKARLSKKEAMRFAKEFSTIHNTVSESSYEMLFSLAHKIIIKHKISKRLIKGSTLNSHFPEEIESFFRINSGEVYIEDISYIFTLILYSNGILDSTSNQRVLEVLASAYPYEYYQQLSLLSEDSRRIIEQCRVTTSK